MDRALYLFIEFLIGFDFESQLVNLLLELSLLMLLARYAKFEPSQHPLQQMYLFFIRYVLELRVLQRLFYRLHALVHFNVSV